MLLQWANSPGGNQYVGMTAPGNIDPYHRPMVRNPDGSISTVRSSSFNFGNGEVLVPTVNDRGFIMSPGSSVDQYKQTGKNLGTFQTPEQATTYSQLFHDDQAGYYNNLLQYLAPMGSGVWRGNGNTQALVDPSSGKSLYKESPNLPDWFLPDSSVLSTHK